MKNVENMINANKTRPAVQMFRNMKGTVGFRDNVTWGGTSMLTRWEFEWSSGSRRFSLPLPDHVPDALQLGILFFIRVVDVLVPLLRGGFEQPAVSCI